MVAEVDSAIKLWGEKERRRDKGRTLRMNLSPISLKRQNGIAHIRPEKGRHEIASFFEEKRGEMDRKRQ